MNNNDVLNLALKELEALREEYLKNARIRRQEACKYYDARLYEEGDECAYEEEGFILESQGVQKSIIKILALQNKLRGGSI